MLIPKRLRATAATKRRRISVVKRSAPISSWRLVRVLVELIPLALLVVDLAERILGTPDIQGGKISAFDNLNVQRPLAHCALLCAHRAVPFIIVSQPEPI